MANAADDKEVQEIVKNLAQSISEQGTEIGEVVHVFLVDPFDTAETLSAALGYSPLINRWSGVFYTHPGFAPYWEYMIKHRNWYEMVCVLEDSGFGHVVLFPKTMTDHDLNQLCVIHAIEE